MSELKFLKQTECILEDHANSSTKPTEQQPDGCLDISMQKLWEPGQHHAGEITSLRLYDCGYSSSLGDYISRYFTEGVTSLRELDMCFDEPPCPRTSHLPLDSEPFCKINNLTKFYFEDTKLAAPLDTFLPFLRGNPSLKEVKLKVGTAVPAKYDPQLQGPGYRQPQEQAPVNLSQLQSLHIDCRSALDIKFLISHISLPKGVELWVSSKDDSPGLYSILPSIKGVDKSPTHMHVDWTSGCKIDISGPNGRFCFNLSRLEQRDTILKEDGLISLKEIQELKLTQAPIFWSPRSPLPLFPALKVFTINGVENVSAALSKFFLFQGSFPKLDKLEIKKHDSSESQLLINWERPQSLQVECCSWQGIANLVAHISLLECAMFEAYTKEVTKLVEESPTCVHMDGNGEDIRFSGPNGNLSFHGLSEEKNSSLFEEGDTITLEGGTCSLESGKFSRQDGRILFVPGGSSSFEIGPISFEAGPISFEGVQELHLINRPLDLALKPSLFPALETLIIENNQEISKILSKLFASPKPSFPRLKRLEIKNCTLSDSDISNFKKFASKHKKNPLYNTVVIQGPKKDTSPKSGANQDVLITFMHYDSIIKRIIHSV